MVKKIDKIAPFIFLTISSVLIFSWFRFGFMYGGGDTGLPTYNPLVMAQIAKDIWWDSLAPGIPVAQGLTSTPLLFFLSIPQVLGASPVFIQAFLFFVLLFLMGYGMYLLALSVFGRSSYLIALLAGVFYLFNPYMMIQIWHRFIHNSMVFVAFLPYLILTWLWWIRKRSPLYLLLFLLVNFLAVYIYGTIAFIVAVWTLFTLLTLLEAFIPWQGRKVCLRLLLAFFIGLILWLLTNSWWLIPTFSVSPALFASQHTTDDSLTTLLVLSSQTILQFTFRLINPFYLYWQADFGNIYQNTFFILISWLFVPVVFIGFIRGLRQKAYLIWSLLFLIVIYLAKGAAPPFPFPYIFSFSHFFPLGVIRNPFEKLGILLPLIYAVLFALGLELIIIFLHKYIGKVKTYITLVIFACLYMTFFHPMFTGKLFGNLDKPSFVSIPKAYTEANEWIKQDLEITKSSGEGRILHLPLPQSEDVTYNWQYGYSGVEPSAAIFTALPSIARGLDIPRVNDVLSGLSLIFHTPYVTDSSVILKMLQDFNVKYIVLHKDIEWLGGELYNPAETETILDKLEFITKKIIFGDLVVYKLKDDYFRSKVIISDNVDLLYPSKRNSFWPWMIATPSAELVNIVAKEQENNILDKVNKIIALPEKSTIIKNLEVPKFKGNLDNFNNIRLLPTSPIYFLIDLKERLSLIGKPEAVQQQTKIIFAEKRLVEAYKIKRMRESAILDQKIADQLIISLIKKYKEELNDIFSNELIIGNVMIGNQENSVLDVFLKHISLLEDFINSPGKDDEKDLLRDVILLINKDLDKNGFLPKYPQIGKDGPVKDFRQQFTFNIPFKLDYNFLMNGAYLKKIYPNYPSEMIFQIDEMLKNAQEEYQGNLAIFGKNELEVGEHQITTSRLSSVNLAPKYSDFRQEGNVTISEATGTIEISSGTNSFSFVDGDIKSAYGGEYLFSFDLKVLSGKGIRVQIIQNTDKIDKKSNQAILRYNNYYIPADFDSNGWNHFAAITSLSSTTQHAKLKIQVEPWEDCLVILGNKNSCLDEKVRQQYNQSSMFLIKNLTVSRQLNNDIFLRADLPLNKSASSSGMILQINKQNPSLYKGKVTILKPTFLVFKDSFDPDWELSLTRGQDIYKPSQHLVANLFANAWIIEETGDYDFILSYRPRTNLPVGILFAGLGWVIVVFMFAVGYNFRRLSKIK